MNIQNEDIDKLGLVDQSHVMGLVHLYNIRQYMLAHTIFLGIIAGIEVFRLIVSLKS